MASMPIINHPSQRVHIIDPIVPASYTKMTASTLPFNISKGSLNKLRIRPQILNEHCEPSNTVQGVVTATNKVGQVFKASQDNINSIYLTLESASSVTVDTFETYTTSAQLQAVWIASSTLATLETLVIYSTPNAMRLPATTNGISWVKTFAAVDMTDYTGSFRWRQTSDYGSLKGRVFVSDGTNSKSSPLAVNSVNNWEKFTINIGAMVEDGAGTTNDAAITKIGFIVEKKAVGAYFYVDTVAYTPPPGTVQLELWDMGTTLPESGVTSIDDGTQYVTLGDLATQTASASYSISLRGGKTMYHLHQFAAGVALENPANVLLNVNNYYTLILSYTDTEVSVYGNNPTTAVDRYTNGYSFNTTDNTTAIVTTGPYGDCMFGIFSTADVYITKATAQADSMPGHRATYHSFIEDRWMVVTDIIHTQGFHVPESQEVDLGDRPPKLSKGGKFEIYYNDDFGDAVAEIWFGMQYFYEPVVVHG